MEVLALEHTLTELGHGRLLNLLRRDARRDGSTSQRRCIEDVPDVCALDPSREVAPEIVTGKEKVAEIVAIRIQPESSGDYKM